jgi:4-amino-4-deoxy-L-arabinose transferase
MRKSSIVIIAGFILIYILPLGVRPIIIPDEARYAEIPREMIASGDWIVPRLNGIRYFEKPVLGYWLNAVSMSIFGENAFAVRFPSALAAGLSGLMLFMLVRRFTGSHFKGILSAVIFLTCSEVFAVGTFSVLDSLLSMFLTAAMVSFFFAYSETDPKKKNRLLAIFGACCGLAFLTKGFLAFAVPVVTVIPFMIWEKRLKELFRIAWIPIIAAILISLPWSVMIHFRESDFWHYFFWVEHINRFMSDMPQHPQPLWYFVPVILLGALPWTALIPTVIPTIKETDYQDSFFRFVLCWLFFPFLFFSSSEGKLGTYILPCFSPLAIRLGLGIPEYFESGEKKKFLIAVTVLCILSGIMLILLALNQITGFIGIKVYEPDETWKWMFGSAGSAAGIVLMILSARQSDFRKRLWLYAASPLLFMFGTQFILPDLTRLSKAPGDFLMSHSDKVRADTLIVSYENPLQAVCWFYKRDDVYVLMKGDELSYGLAYEDSKHRLLNAEQFGQLVAENSGKRGVVLISKFREYEQYKNKLPKPLSEQSNGEFVFAQF